MERDRFLETIAIGLKGVPGGGDLPATAAEMEVDLQTGSALGLWLVPQAHPSVSQTPSSKCRIRKENAGYSDMHVTPI
jgi:hypothetical protein